MENDNYEYKETKSFKPINEIKNIVHFIFFLIITSVFFFTTLYSAIVNLQGDTLWKNENEVVSVISKIEKNSSSDHYNVYVTYEIDNISYTTTLGLYTSSMSVGDEVIVKYLSSDHSVIRYGNTSTIYYCLFGACTLIFSLNVFFLIKRIYSNHLLRSLKLSGSKKTLIVIDHIKNYNTSYNKKYPYNLLCVDKLTNNLYYSNNTLLYPLQKYPINTEVSMYTDNENIDNYYIDCE